MTIIIKTKYAKITIMKFRILLSIFFLIITTFSSIHKVEHIVHDDDSLCLVCHVNDNLASADIIDKAKDVEIFYFEKISHNNQVSDVHVKKHTDQDRAPPSLS